MKHANLSLIHVFLALLSGILLALAFSPSSFVSFAVFGPMLLYYLLQNTTPLDAFMKGSLCGVGFFSVGVSWVFVSIHVYGDASLLLSLVLTGIFVGVLAIFYGLMSFLYIWFSYAPRNDQSARHNSKNTLLFPTLWVIFEILRSHLFTGFPWLLLGFSQTTGPFRHFIPVIGIVGTSFMVILCSVLACECLMNLCKQHYQSALKNSAAILILFMSGYLLSLPHWTQKIGPPIPVKLIQGNISQSVKWSLSETNHTLAKFKSLTHFDKANEIVIWPEAAIPLALDAAKGYLDQFDKQAKAQHATLITGIPIVAEDDIHYYNGLIALGATHGRYAKRHLVPFGEYIPFEKWLGHVFQFLTLPMSSEIPGARHQPSLVINGLHVATFICYEIAYSQLFYDSLRQADLLLTLSNDDWFGDSFAPWQHLQIAQARSLQSGRYQLIANNSGVTAIIAPDGRIMKRAPQFAAAVLRGEVYKTVGETPWNKWGNWPLYFLMSLLLLHCGRYIVTSR